MCTLYSNIVQKIVKVYCTIIDVKVTEKQMKSTIGHVNTEKKFDLYLYHIHFPVCNM